MVSWKSSVETKTYLSNISIIPTNSNKNNKPKVTFCISPEALVLVFMDGGGETQRLNPFQRGAKSYGCQEISPELFSRTLMPPNLKRISSMRIKTASSYCLCLSSSPFLYWLDLEVKKKKKADVQLHFGSTPQHYWFNNGEGIQSAYLFFHIKHLY